MWIFNLCYTYKLELNKKYYCQRLNLIINVALGINPININYPNVTSPSVFSHSGKSGTESCGLKRQLSVRYIRTVSIPTAVCRNPTKNPFFELRYPSSGCKSGIVEQPPASCGSWPTLDLFFFFLVRYLMMPHSWRAYFSAASFPK